MNELENFKDVNTFLFDVDGVMTTNEVLVMEDGKLLRRLNIRDGLAIKKAIQSSFNFAVISGSRSEGVRLRLERLGVQHIFLGVEDKLKVFEEYTYAHQLDPRYVLYMGDDLPDYSVMRRIGFPTCPSDAVKEVMNLAIYVSPFAGGKGCVRDVIEKVLRIQGKW